MTRTDTPSDELLLEVRGLSKTYSRGRGWLRRPGRRRAFTDVDLELRRGRTVGLVGGSGAGKSSLARCLALMERPDAGRILLEGRDLVRLAGADLRTTRRRIQLVFQDSAAAFHPRWSARRALEEPLAVAGVLDRAARRRRVEALAEQMGLEACELDRPASEFSGGQLKRLDLARALTAQPRVLILDEPFAGLDVSLKAQVANLLVEVLRRHRPACLHISHDLGMVSHLADEVVVLDRGRVVERGPVARILTRPETPPTRRLIEAAQPVSA